MASRDHSIPCKVQDIPISKSCEGSMLFLADLLVPVPPSRHGSRQGRAKCRIEHALASNTARSK